MRPWLAISASFNMSPDGFQMLKRAEEAPGENGNNKMDAGTSIRGP
jgi:hypothetical protein